MLAGYDVKTEDKERVKYLIKYFGVKFGPQEEKLYLDKENALNSCGSHLDEEKD